MTDDKRNRKQEIGNDKAPGNDYNAKEIESKWQEKWEEEKIYQPDLDTSKRPSTGSGSKGPFYNLMMFPYPSAEGLHVGNVYTFGGIDAYGRFKRMQGYSVFQPFGLDGFGIHSENYAIKVGRTPQEHASISEKHFYEQMHLIGNGYDWSRSLETYKPDYYKWTQWLFIELFKAGLAYKDKATVNFCPSCKTVLSDEQVIDGKCERCSSIVEKRDLEQWFFRITDYAERLLANTEKLDWTEKVKIAQKNWIGKKSGINITYKVKESDKEVTVFTTRPDTNFGATFIAMSPEHPLVLELTTNENKEAVKKYIADASKKTEIERASEGKEKTGVFTGSYAINDLTGFEMPIYLSDFVLGGFGTGVLVGVPGHDKRDFEFAQKFGLKIIRVVIGGDGDTSSISKIEQVQEEEGKMINSEFLDGLDIHKATEKIMDYMEKKGSGKRVVSYHLRDWLISRQRYWGPPIPMIYCESCAKEGKSWFTAQVQSSKFPDQIGIPNGKDHRGKVQSSAWKADGWYPEENLPVLLPVVEDFKPLGTGKAPLANYPEFYETVCPGCGGDATRETDVSDTFLDSSWYFFRYIGTDFDSMPFPSPAFLNPKSEARNPKQIQNINDENSKQLRNSNFDIRVSAQRAKKWLPVTSYIGGAEHAVLHLLYSRFITMVFKDLGYIDFEEPYTRFRANGLIIKDGAKMSKSKGNVINPDDYVKKYGADTLRTYLGFIGPFTQGGDFQDSGIEGVNKFLKRVWKLANSKWLIANSENLNKDRVAMMHKIVRGVTEDMEELRFNTAIAKIMTYYNFLSDQKELSRSEVEVLLKLLAPFAPHMTEELYQQLFRNSKFSSIHISDWPYYDIDKIASDTVIIAVQINGKLRDTLEVSSSMFQVQSNLEKIARESENVKRHLEGKSVKKVIYVPGKILNFVI
jgi:leucyl-tRNA synthetase